MTADGRGADADEVAWTSDSEIEGIAAQWPGEPLPRYVALTDRQAHYQAVSDRLAEARAAVIAQLGTEGFSYARIAAMTGLSRSRVQQLAERGRQLRDAGEFDLLARPGQRH